MKASHRVYVASAMRPVWLPMLELSELTDVLSLCCSSDLDLNCRSWFDGLASHEVMSPFTISRAVRRNTSKASADDLCIVDWLISDIELSKDVELVKILPMVKMKCRE